MYPNPMKVLLVEDDPLGIEVFKTLVKGLESTIELRLADTLESAINILKRFNIEGIILDLRLSNGEWGGTLLEELAGLALPQPPIVVVTTWTTGRHTLDSISAKGADRVFCKGDLRYDPAEVIACLLDMRPYLSPRSAVAAFAPVLTEEEKERQLLDDIQAFLVQAGGDLNGVGFTYLKFGLLAQARLGHRAGKLTADIYPFIQTHMDTSTTAAIKAGLERAVNFLWSGENENLKWIQSQYKPPVKASLGAPSVKAFIAYFGTKFWL